MQLDIEPEMMQAASMTLSAASVMAAKAYEQAGAAGGAGGGGQQRLALPSPQTIMAEATTVSAPPSAPFKVPTAVVVPSTTATTEPAIPKEKKEAKDGGKGSGEGGVSSNVVAAAGMGATPVAQRGEAAARTLHLLDGHGHLSRRKAGGARCVCACKRLAAPAAHRRWRCVLCVREYGTQQAAMHLHTH